MFQRLAGDDRVMRAELLLRSARTRERAGAFSTALRNLGAGRRLISSLESTAAAQTRARLSAFAALVLWAQDRAHPALRQAETAVATAREAG